MASETKRSHFSKQYYSTLVIVVIVISGALAAYIAHPIMMMPSSFSSITSWALAMLVSGPGAALGLFVRSTNTPDVDLAWYPPNKTSINDLETALHGQGIYGFIFNSSHTPDAQYGTYNWCNMPHVRKTEYVKAPAEYELRYVEVIQRHHKRTPYASNAFPTESYHWDCDDQGLYYYGTPFGEDHPRRRPAPGFWKSFISPVNPYIPSGWIGTCQFPQITAPGLDDSYEHGRDIYGVYHELLGFLPSRHGDWRNKVIYRVTQNVITSQVAGMLIGGMWDTSDSVPLIIEAAGIDSLEPQYPCAAGSTLFNQIKSPTSDSAWKAHLDGAADVYRILDDISGVPPTDAGFHASFDHYFDNLSARQCHAKPLPCKLAANDGGGGGGIAGASSAQPCVDQTLTDTVYRLGQWEYSHSYRDAPRSLAASVASYGVWIAELAAHLRTVISGDEEAPLYFHNLAHDGSVSRILSILQIDVMTWPGMGSEVMFELYNKAQSTGGKPSLSEHYVRVLFGGRVLQSSSPSLGIMDMVPAETLLTYFDGLVGREASLILGKCNGTIEL